MSKKDKPERIPSAGEQYRVESSVKWIRKGEHDVGTKRNADLPLPEKEWQRSDRDEDSYASVPEYSDPRDGGRTKIRVKANKPNASKPSAARPDNSPDNKFQRSTSGPRHPGKGVTGASPRHPSSKPVSSLPSGGPRQAKGKDSTNVNDSTAYGRNYGNREPVGNATVRKRSDVVPADSSMISSDNNPKHREAAYPGIGRESLKDAKPKK